jgi:lipoate-protein ligase A
MALDEYLFNVCHKKSTTFLRLYTWEKPTFSIGVSQKIDKALNLDYIKKHDCEYVRRVTGGKAVLHHDELTYALVSSDDIFFKEHDLYKSYLLISRILVKALKNFKIAAYLHKENDTVLARSDNPCFSFPTPNEIEINDKKIIGSAQKRDNKALLQHGSIPFSMDYSMYAEGTGSRRSIIQRAMTCINDVSDLKKEKLVQELIEEFGTFMKQELVDFNSEFGNDSEFRKLKKKYQSEEWNLKL